MSLLNAILPKTTLEYQCPYTQQEIVRMLQKHIEPKQALRRVDVPLEHKKFEGAVDDDRFEISQVPDQEGYHACRILGEIIPAGKGARVVVRMGTPKSYIYSYLFFPLLLAVCLSAFPFSSIQPEQFFPVYLSLASGVVFVLAFPFIIAKKVKKVQEDNTRFFDELFGSENKVNLT